jgi:signal transduction histidine kinase
MKSRIRPAAKPHETPPNPAAHNGHNGQNGHNGHGVHNADGSIAKENPWRPEDEALRVLLVEDNAADVELIAHILRNSVRNISVIVVDTQKEFEAELGRRQPNLILSDYRLPMFDGRAALEIAKRLAPHVPFIFVTGVLGEEIAIETLKQGATDYVLKNHLTRLAPAVNRALRETEQRREHERAEERLQRSHDQLRALTGHLQFVREEERTRIAREVHDELGQALTGIKLDLSWLAGHRLVGNSGLRGKIKEMAAHVDATIHTVRRIATELRPGVLDSLGLAAAIEWQAADFQTRTGIRCEVKISATEAIPNQDFSTVIFRIFQETLTNIIRHAKATWVEVRLAQDGHDLILTVRDNGRGITEKEVVHSRSIGLIGMQERAAQLGGVVHFSGLPARGTTVTMRVPLPPSEPHKGIS